MTRREGVVQMDCATADSPLPVVLLRFNMRFKLTTTRS